MIKNNKRKTKAKRQTRDEQMFTLFMFCMTKILLQLKILAPLCDSHSGLAYRSPTLSCRVLSSVPFIYLIYLSYSFSLSLSLSISHSRNELLTDAIRSNPANRHETIDRKVE